MQVAGPFEDDDRLTEQLDEWTKTVNVACRERLLAGGDESDEPAEKRDDQSI